MSYGLNKLLKGNDFVVPIIGVIQGNARSLYRSSFDSCSVLAAGVWVYSRSPDTGSGLL